MIWMTIYIYRCNLPRTPGSESEGGVRNDELVNEPRRSNAGPSFANFSRAKMNIIIVYCSVVL